MFHSAYNTNREFSWDNFHAILDLLVQDNWQTRCCLDYAMQKDSLSSSSRQIIIRVDVDRSPAKAMSMAQALSSHNCRATFFFRLHSPFYNILSFDSMRIISDIEAAGFEIGLHCEPVDLYYALEKDPALLFRNDITILNSILTNPIQGAASHGDNSGFNNLDFWQTYTPAEFGLAYEAYDEASLTLFNHSTYLSDSPLTHWKQYKNGKLDNTPISNARTFFHEYGKTAPPVYWLLHPFLFRTHHFFEDQRLS